MCSCDAKSRWLRDANFFHKTSINMCEIKWSRFTFIKTHYVNNWPDKCHYVTKICHYATTAKSVPLCNKSKPLCNNHYVTNCLPLCILTVKVVTIVSEFLPPDWLWILNQPIHQSIMQASMHLRIQTIHIKLAE